MSISVLSLSISGVSHIKQSDQLLKSPNSHKLTYAKIIIFLSDKEFSCHAIKNLELVQYNVGENF